LFLIEAISISLESFVDKAIGFSITTCLFAFKHCIACCACNPFGVQIFTTSISLFDNKLSIVTWFIKFSYFKSELMSAMAINAALGLLEICMQCFWPI
jgi:hypothetical protein